MLCLVLDLSDCAVFVGDGVFVSVFEGWLVPSRVVMVHVGLHVEGAGAARIALVRERR